MGFFGFLFNFGRAFIALLKLAFFLFFLGVLFTLFLVASNPDWFSVW